MRYKLLFILVVLLGLFLRLWKINIPLLEFSPSRQIQTAEITRNILNDRFNFLYPRVNYYGKDPDKYFLVEFPVYNLVVATIDLLSPNYEINGRLVSVAFYLLATVFLYKIAWRLFDQRIALLSALFFAISPLNILTSRSFQPDEMLIAMSLGAFYYLMRWVKQGKWYFYCFSLLLLSFSVLIKITVLVYLGVPLLFLIFSYKKRWKFLTAIYFGLSILPFVVWYLHSSAFSQSLQIQSAGTYSISTWFGLNSFVNFKYYSNIFGYETNLVLLPVGIMLFVVGLFSKIKQVPLVLYLWLISLILYFLIFNKHVMTHEYYHLPFLPLASIFVGLGAQTLIESLNKKIHFGIKNISILLLVIILLIFFSTTKSRAYEPIERFNNVLFVGSRIEKLTKSDDLIIGLMDEGPALVHYSNRYGWGFEVDPVKIQAHQEFIGATKTVIDPINTLESLRTKGAVIFASSYKPQLLNNPKFSNYLYKNFPVLEEDQNYVIFKLN